MLLLQLNLDESILNRKGNIFEDRRYRWNGINRGYIKGDKFSWQRYTSHRPVDCHLQSSLSDKYRSKTRDSDPFDCYVKLIPWKKLRYDTTYAVLLCNNVSIVPAEDDPMGFMDQRDVHASGLMRYESTVYGIQEDKLIVFRTEKRT